MYKEIKNDIIDAIADYYRIESDPNSYEWQAGATILGADGEYRWLTLSDVLSAIDGVIENIAYNFDD